MTFLHSTSPLIVLAGAFGVFNNPSLKRTPAIGILTVARLPSFGILGLALVFSTFSAADIMRGWPGGICAALAPSFPDDTWKPLILTASSLVLIVSFILQGLSVVKLATTLGPTPELPT